jgi:rhodanese-related sulfurtransferase
MKNLILLLSLTLLMAWQPAFASDAQLMSKEELKDKLNTANLTILDVRSGRDWSSSEFKIKGAVRAPGSEIAEWSKNYKKDQTLVLYCA